MIKYCKNCSDKNITHEFQDKTYGKYIRVQNPTYKKDGCRCTVCKTSN